MASPDPKKLYVNIEPHVGPDGITYREGDVLRGSHPDIKKHLDMFYVEEGIPTDEKHAIHQKRFLVDPLERELRQSGKGGAA